MTTTRTAQGLVAGTEHDGVIRFAGIPYAAPTSGPGRFRAPQPAEPWSGVRAATTYGPVAPQQDMFAAMLGMDPEPQDEACLYLNVFTPAVDDSRRPVMVWIHGGAFVLGSGSNPGYDGASLAKRGDVVVVTINYRLGALGFLHLAELSDDYPEAGNLGILDQIAALRWVQENIEAFGGDPGNVTIFGESAGGMSVGTLLGTPAARGLFHKAIPQSGGAHNTSPVGHAAEITQSFLAASGVATVEELVALPLEQLLACQQEFVTLFFTGVEAQMAHGPNVRLPFQPTVDGVMLDRPAIDNITAGNAEGVPVLLGTCRDEWNLFRFMDQSTVDQAVLEQRVAKIFDDPARAIETYRAVLPSAAPDELFGAMVTDLVFRQPAIRLAETLRAHGSPTYTYLFTWATPALGGVLGACHALDVPFAFGNLESTAMGFLLGDDPPPALAEAMQGSWLAFARTGDPSTELVGEWPQYDADTRPTMELGDDIRLLNDPEPERRELWQGLLQPGS
jgi:para-nitrobenzyl esterase